MRKKKENAASFSVYTEDSGREQKRKRERRGQRGKVHWAFKVKENERIKERENLRDIGQRILGPISYKLKEMK